MSAQDKTVLSELELEAANADPTDRWIYLKCKECGNTFGCFNRTIASYEQRCFVCGWLK